MQAYDGLARLESYIRQSPISRLVIACPSQEFCTEEMAMGIGR